MVLFLFLTVFLRTYLVFVLDEHATFRSTCDGDFQTWPRECAGVGSVMPEFLVVVEACTPHIALEGWVF